MQLFLVVDIIFISELLHFLRSVWSTEIFFVYYFLHVVQRIFLRQIHDGLYSRVNWMIVLFLFSSVDHTIIFFCHCYFFVAIDDRILTNGHNFAV